MRPIDDRPTVGTNWGLNWNWLTTTNTFYDWRGPRQILASRKLT